MNKAERKELFGPLIKVLRNELGLTLRETSRHSRIPHSVIAATENGRRSMTAVVAARLLDVLKAGDETAFLLKAADTTKEHKVLPELLEYGAYVLNAMAIYLARLGIQPDQIEWCELKSPPPPQEPLRPNDVQVPAALYVHLTSKEILLVTITASFIDKENEHNTNGQLRASN